MEKRIPKVGEVYCTSVYSHRYFIRLNKKAEIFSSNERAIYDSINIVRGECAYSSGGKRNIIGYCELLLILYGGDCE